MGEAKRRQSAFRRATLPSSSLPLTGASPRRVGIIFYSAPQGYYTVAEKPLASINDGLLVNTSIDRQEFWLDTHGSVVQQEWFGWALGAGTNIVWLEVME